MQALGLYMQALDLFLQPLGLSLGAYMHSLCQHIQSPGPVYSTWESGRHGNQDDLGINKDDSGFKRKDELGIKEN